MNEYFIERIEINWGFSNECGIEYESFEVGKFGVKEILYHQPTGEGDRHYCDIFSDDGTQVRVFNLNKIIKKPVEGV